MKSLLITTGMMFVASAAYAESCTPNYQIQREECVETNDVIAKKPVSEKVKIEEVRREDKDGKALEDAYCGRKKQDMAAKWKVSPEDVKVDGANNEDTRQPWVEGGVLNPTVGSWRKISCRYSAQAPVFKKVVGDKCAIVGAKDANNCFSASTVSVDESFINGCMTAQATDEVQAWIKTQCLVDAYTAAKQNKVILTSFDKLESAMKAYSKGAPSAHLKEYLRKELGQ